MAARITPFAELHAGYVRVICEPDPRSHFVQRLRKRLRKLEKKMPLRERILEDLSRMVRRVG